MTAAPPPRRYVTTEYRRRPLAAGVGLCLLGLVVLLLGAAILWGSQTVEVLAAEGRAGVGSPVRFDAGAGEYSVVLLLNPLVHRDVDNAVARIRCTVQGADGVTTRLDGLDRTTRLETSLGRELTSFHAEQAGATTVLCAWKESASAEGYVYAVAPRHTSVRAAGIALTLGGAVLALLGVPLIVIGVRGRAVMHRSA